MTWTELLQPLTEGKPVDPPRVIAGAPSIVKTRRERAAQAAAWVAEKPDRWTAATADDWRGCCWS